MNGGLRRRGSVGDGVLTVVGIYKQRQQRRGGRLVLMVVVRRLVVADTKVFGPIRP